MSLGKSRPVQDWPSVNLMVRRQDFLKIGGFDCPYWPGEDTKLCMNLIQETGKSIMYVPEMFVWHHRRAGLIAHLKQVGGYGLHRGYFAKKYPKTSRRIKYFVPTLFMLFVISNAFIPVLPSQLRVILYSLWACYFIAICAVWYDVRKYEKISVANLAALYTVLSHLFYGVRFAQGLVTTKLESKLR